MHAMNDPVVLQRCLHGRLNSELTLTCIRRLNKKLGCSLNVEANTTGFIHLKKHDVNSVGYHRVCFYIDHVVLYSVLKLIYM